jgi:lipopolysaccharide export system protein LptA
VKRRIGLIAVLLVAITAPAFADSAADIFGGFQSKSKDPIQVDAATLETYEEGTQRVSVFSGGVTVKRGNTLMKAGTIKLYSNIDASAANAFTRIEASDKIYVTSADQTVTGQTAVVDMKTNTITVGGGVVLSQGANVITGSRLVVNLATGRARVEQEAGKQIRGVFSPGGATTGQ